MDVQINGRVLAVEESPQVDLLSVLREDLDLTGTKGGCGSGSCGACTVLVDGRPERSCLLRLEDVAGRAVTTIEGLGEEGRLHPVQRAFLDQQVAQCGWCVPAQVLTAVALLHEMPRPGEAVVRERLSAVLCRCGTYQRAVAAVLQAAQQAGTGQ